MTTLSPVREGDLATIQSQGSPRDTSPSVLTLFTTLVPTLITSSFLTSLFLFLRKRWRWLYMPRTFLDVLDDDEKTPTPSQNGTISWFRSFWDLSDDYVLKHHSLEAYLFLRFFRMVVLLCTVGCCITWPILLPVNILGGNNNSQLDRISIGNIGKPRLYYAHAIVACLYFSFILFTITRETVYFIHLRQAYLTTPWISSKLSSRTVLYTSVPDEYLDESSLRRTFDSVKRVWIGSDCRELRKAVNKRNEAAMNLEAGQVTQSKNAAKLTKNDSRPSFASMENLKPKIRPTKRRQVVVGRKYDVINRYRDLLEEAIPDVEKKQRSHRDGTQKPTGAVFIEFETLAAAQAAYQQTVHQTPLKLTPKSVGASPESIIWDNLDMNEIQRRSRLFTATSLMAGLTIFWSIPVAIVGSLANVDSLTSKIPFLKFIDDLPPAIVGAITGLLPTLLLSAVISLIPMLCRYLAKLSGEVTQAEIEKRVQTWYFIFQVVQVFLITTFSSGAAAVVVKIIEHPEQTPRLLSKNLPKASNFYISYFIVYGLGQASFYLLRISSVLLSGVVSRLLDNTPRKKFDRIATLEGLGWGSLYPKFTNLAVIAIVYSCIAPLSLGFASIGLYLLYLAFRYNILYVIQTKVDTQGQLYAKAMKQLLAGVYLAEFCLIGLFGFGSKNKGSIGPILILSLFTIATVVYHALMRNALDPLTKTIPASLLHDIEQDDTHDSERGEATEDTPLISTPSGPSGAVIGPVNRYAELLLKFFNPEKYASYEKLRHLLSSSPLNQAVPPYSDDEIRTAYLDPAITSTAPKLWIVRDNLGLSRDEVRRVAGLIPATDEGASFDRNGKIIWNQENIRSAPIWKQPIPY